MSICDWHLVRCSYVQFQTEKKINAQKLNRKERPQTMQNKLPLTKSNNWTVFKYWFLRLADYKLDTPFQLLKHWSFRVLNIFSSDHIYLKAQKRNHLFIFTKIKHDFLDNPTIKLTHDPWQWLSWNSLLS